MDNNSKKQLQKSVIEWLSQSEQHTQSEFASKTGISGSYINQVVNGKWSDKYPSVSAWQTIAKFVGWEYHIDSDNYLNIKGLLKRAIAEKARFGINGVNSGEGKTYSIARFCKSTPHAYHIICRESMSAKALLVATAKVLRISKAEKMKAWELEDSISEYINRKGGVLIFDECEYIEEKRGAINGIKTLCDLIQGKAGIVICGLDAKGMINNLMSRKKNRGIPQFRRRFNFKWFTTLPIKNSEIKNFCLMNGIVDKHAIAWFQNNIDNYDSLVVMVKDAVKVAAANNIEPKDIDTDFLNTVFED